MTSTWQLRTGPDEALEDRLTEGLVAYNQERSAAVRERFEPDNLRAEPLAAYAVDPAGDLVGGCTGRVERTWHWLTVDTMWVRERQRGQGLGTALLASVEEQARLRGCRWSEVTTWEFQAPGFYTGLGYVEFGRKVDYPPGHTNFYLRKDL